MTIAARPVDAFAPPPSFAFPRLEAMRLGCCARCGRDVNPSALAPVDAREYRISALGPACTAELEAMFEEWL